MQRLLAFLTVCAFAPSTGAAHTEARLVLSAATGKPGETITAAVRLKMDPGWHTYWKNPGASGQATKIEWQLPAGVTAGEIQWPVPEKFVTLKTGDDGKPLPGQFDFENATYVYHYEVILLVPLKLATDLKPGPLVVKAKVSWLECETLCVPGKADVKETLEIGSETKPSAEAARIETWRDKLPGPADSLSARAEWEKPASANSRPLILEWKSAKTATEPDFFPDASDEFEVQAESEVVSAGPDTIRLRKTVKKLSRDWPKQIQGIVVAKEGGQLRAWAVKLPIEGSVGGMAASVPFSWAALLGQLGSAFLGGLILNIMPCVFPVIALKIFGFVQQSHDEPRRVFALGLIYGLGVLASFLVMAGLVIAIKQTGGSASWGMQFKSPQISVGFIALVVLIAVNLFGVFEVNVGGRAMGAAGQLASKHGPAGAFFNGVLATILATPCTAPILASALGFAFAQPPLVILLFFLTIGLGLAFPYVLLSWKPGWLKFLPRPGAWMEKFKVAMGFPMLATAVWIFWFTAPRFGEDGVIWIG
ncbi:MAG TPA: protein-disulfide reductase DsbD domain-containing protein, partial [Verrucomicrobiae bacterium]|nr:protein-disulfide reductase DsbD domain-containing protein [Verrucomicrobiae bacterium]